MRLGPCCHRRVAALAVVVGAAAAQQLGEVSAAAWVLVAAALGASKGHLWRHRARPSSVLLAVVRWCSLLLLHPPVLPPTVAPARAAHCAGRLVCLLRWWGARGHEGCCHP